MGLCGRVEGVGERGEGFGVLPECCGQLCARLRRTLPATEDDFAHGPDAHPGEAGEGWRVQHGGLQWVFDHAGKIECFSIAYKTLAYRRTALYCTGRRTRHPEPEPIR